VNQQTAGGFISAGAVALGIGEALIPWEAVALRQSNRIRELCRRFLNFVQSARSENATRLAESPAPLGVRSDKLVEVLNR
jgi:hypothetical protein